MYENFKPEVVNIVKKFGHIALSPRRYHSDLDSLEFLWAYNKRNIGRSYVLVTTLTEVEEKLKTQFECLLSESRCSLIESMIESLDKKVTKFCADFLYYEESSQFSDVECRSGETSETERDFNSSSQ